MPATPCSYQTKNHLLWPIGPVCGKVCDDAEKMCPRHILVSKAEADELRRKERLKEEKRKANLRAGARR